MESSGRTSMRKYQLRIPLEGPGKHARGKLRLPPTKKPKATKPSAPAQATRPNKYPLYIAVFGLLVLISCATISSEGPAPLGIRSGFADLKVQKILIAPVVSEGGFGLSQEEHKALSEVYASQSALRLRALGFEVLTPSEIGDESVMEGLSVHRSLSELFEPSRQGEQWAVDDERRALLQTLGSKFQAEAIYFGQILYHTSGTCQGSTNSPYTPHVVLAEGQPQEDRVSCTTGHFQAKLVHTQSAQTLWFNRVLREVRNATLASPSPDPLANARALVDLTLNSPSHGLTQFASKE